MYTAWAFSGIAACNAQETSEEKGSLEDSVEEREEEEMGVLSV